MSPVNHDVSAPTHSPQEPSLRPQHCVSQARPRSPASTDSHTGPIQELLEEPQDERAGLEALVAETSSLKGEHYRLTKEVEWLRALVGHSLGGSGESRVRHCHRKDPEADQEGGSSAGREASVEGILCKLIADLTKAIGKLTGLHENCLRQAGEQEAQVKEDKGPCGDIPWDHGNAVGRKEETTTGAQFTNIGKFVFDKVSDFCVSLAANLGSSRASLAMDLLYDRSPVVEQPSSGSVTSIASLGVSSNLERAILVTIMTILFSNMLWGGVGSSQVLGEKKPQENEKQTLEDEIIDEAG